MTKNIRIHSIVWSDCSINSDFHCWNVNTSKLELHSSKQNTTKTMGVKFIWYIKFHQTQSPRKNHKIQITTTIKKVPHFSWFEVRPNSGWAWKYLDNVYLVQLYMLTTKALDTLPCKAQLRRVQNSIRNSKEVWITWMIRANKTTQVALR